ncbi:MAG: 50S ribosomal protein L31e [Candidatus ainarchaeum sp.]|nr:50S ribosomal protein L31e [Candidatus ainarchaeum sp.]
MADEIVFTVPLSDAYACRRTMRAKKSMQVLTAFLSRHMKVGEESVRIDAKLNDYIWSHGIKKPPHKVKVKAKRGEGGKVFATLLEESPAPAEKPAAKKAGEGKAGKPAKAAPAAAKKAANGKEKEKPVK